MLIFNWQIHVAECKKNCVTGLYLMCMICMSITCYKVDTYVVAILDLL